MASDKHYPYDIAISYAGEDRDIASALAESFRSQGIIVFYDGYEKANLWGRNLYDYLSDLYQNQAHYCVMLLSQHYAQKVWTTHEREAAQNRAVSEHKEYILPIRLDETDIPGHLKTLVYLNWHEETVETITQAVLEKLGKTSKTLPSPWLPLSSISIPQTQRTLAPQKAVETQLEEDNTSNDLNKEKPTQSILHFPRQRNSFFIGRKEILNQLHDKLTTSNNLTQPQPQILSGLAGIGKTQLAIEFAYKYQQEYLLILWLSAETRSSLITDIVKIPNLYPSQVSETEINEQLERNAIASFRAWLASQDRWLLILDNINDLQFVYELLPTKSQGHVLLTTQIQDVGNVGNKIEVEKLSREEGVTLLLQSAKILREYIPLDLVSEKNRRNAETIVEKLDGLPLSLDQAGAFIEETSCSVEEYINLFEKFQIELLKRRRTLFLNHQKSIYTTISDSLLSLSLQSIKERNFVAIELIQFIAFLSPDAIPEELIKEGLYEFNHILQKLASQPLEFREAIGLLLRYSLIHYNSDTRAYTVHRVVQMIIRDKLDEDTKYKWAKQAIYAVNQMFPLASIKHRMRRKRLFPQVQQCFKIIQEWDIAIPEAGTLLTKAAAYLRKEKRYLEAESYGQQALNIREQVLGLKHPDVATTLHGIGLAYSGMGKYELSETFTKRALIIRKKALGSNNPKTLSLINDFAFLYYKKGDNKTAERIYKNNLKKRERVLGPTNISTSTTLNNLALVYINLEKYEDAEILFKRALDIRIAVNPKSVNVAITSNNLGRLYSMQGKYDLAEFYYQNALKIREQAYHEDTIPISDTLRDLANLYKIQGLYKNAEPLYHRALVIRENIIGLQPSMMIEVLEDYADVLTKLNCVSEAELHKKRAKKFKDDIVL